MNKAVVDEAKRWLGTPYHCGAKLKGIGVDCGMFIIGVAENAGQVPKGEINPGCYANDWHLHRNEEMYLKWVEKYCDRVDDPEPGDIVLYRFGRCVSHGSIVVDWPMVIHSYINEGVIYSDAGEAMFFDKRGRSRIYGFYRIRRR